MVYKLGKSAWFDLSGCKWIICIGICSDFDLIDENFELECNDSTKFYTYNTKREVVSHEDEDSSCDDFADRYYGWRGYVPGDIICIELNLLEKCIKFYLNGTDEGIAFNDVFCGNDIDYKLAVSIYHRKTELIILKYEEYYPN